MVIMSPRLKTQTDKMNKLRLAVILKNLQSALDPRNLVNAPIELFSYLRDLQRFRRVYHGNYYLKYLPVLFERTSNSTFDPHYVCQAYWTTNRVLQRAPRPAFHVDIASNVAYSAQLSAAMPVFQLELRPPQLKIASYGRIAGDLLYLPFSDERLPSLSCLHVVEHIGLGRYGDRLDPNGVVRALSEMQRVLAREGDLYLSVPVGVPAIHFNACYIFHPADLVGFLPQLELVEFSYVDDTGQLNQYSSLDGMVQDLKYALGLYHFKKPS